MASDALGKAGDLNDVAAAYQNSCGGSFSAVTNGIRKHGWEKGAGNEPATTPVRVFESV